jgi:hypothetical protein
MTSVARPHCTRGTVHLSGIRCSQVLRGRQLAGPSVGECRGLAGRYRHDPGDRSWRD